MDYVRRKTKRYRILTENDSGKPNFDGKTIENRILSASVAESPNVHAAGLPNQKLSLLFKCDLLKLFYL